MKRIIFVPVSALLLSACVMGYRPVGPDRQVIADVYSVEPQITWSSIEQEKKEFWTVDGRALQELVFVKGLEDGEALVNRPGQDPQQPRFRATMGPSEVVELVIDTLSTAGGLQAQTRNLRPFKFGDAPGFHFEFDFLTRGGLTMAGLAAGAVIDGRLYLIVYTGTREYYFPKYRPQVEKLIDSVRMI